MKEVREAYNRKDEIGVRMQGALGMHLGDNTWGAAREAYLGLKGSPERSLQDKAATLAKQLTKKMTSFLSRDPEVTALALKLYDPDLPQPLMGYLKEHVTLIGDDDDGEALELPMIPKDALLYMSDEMLMESLELNRDHYAYLARKRVELEREQDRRVSLGTTLELPAIPGMEAIVDPTQAARQRLVDLLAVHAARQRIVDLLERPLGPEEA